MITRDQLHRLVNELPESDLEEIGQLLEIRRSPTLLTRALDEAPIDDEIETGEEAVEIRLAYSDVVQGKVVSHEELVRLIGRL
jgi:hypothetical protein